MLQLTGAPERAIWQFQGLAFLTCATPLLLWVHLRHRVTAYTASARSRCCRRCTGGRQSTQHGTKLHLWRRPTSHRRPPSRRLTSPPTQLCRWSQLMGWWTLRTATQSCRQGEVQETAPQGALQGKSTAKGLSGWRVAVLRFPCCAMVKTVTCGASVLANKGIVCGLLAPYQLQCCPPTPPVYLQQLACKVDGEHVD